MNRLIVAAFLIGTLYSHGLCVTTAPPREAFLVFSQTPPAGPRITPYLKYQTEHAWREDEVRRRRFGNVRSEDELLTLQQELRAKLLEMIGQLPDRKTPLNARVTGKIQMQGFHIEKVIFESLAGVYVPALLYVPDDRNSRHPAVLVPCGHSADGKVYYQALCQRLVQRGYVTICWDPIGQGERSQFWDNVAKRSRYNLICAEHAVMGNVAYLAGANLARWEIWDGIRAVDYLLTRAEVDPERINITGTSGGGFQAAHIAALDQRIKVAAPSCYITALPMRVYNRIFKDPDSDPEQDLYGMISNGVDHAGLLLLMYPRPFFIAAAVLDFFPIEGTHKTFLEVADLYRRFGHSDRVAMAEGYHEHQYSLENQQAAIDFLDHFNKLPQTRGLPVVKELGQTELQCTRTGQVLVDYPDGKSLLDVIQEYYIEHKVNRTATIRDLYYAHQYPGINEWAVKPYNTALVSNEIRWQRMGSSRVGDVLIDKYVLHHSSYLEMPLLHLHNANQPSRRILLWFGNNGKATADDWPNVSQYLKDGYEVVSFDCRGLGETRMPFKATSIDDPSLAQLDFDHAYVSPLSGVLADYVYNSLLTGRPYYLQMIEDAEIATRFVQAEFHPAETSVFGRGEAYTVAHDVAQTISGITLQTDSSERMINWSDIVKQKREVWPIQYLLPGGAYVR